MTQVCFFMGANGNISLIGLFPFLLVNRIRSEFLLATGVGIFSSGILLPTPLSSERTLSRSLLEVRSIPKVARLNELQFEAVISSQDSTPIISPKEQAQGKYLCRSISLPWRGTSSVEIGDRFWIRATVQPFRQSLNPFTRDAGLFRRVFRGRCEITHAYRAEANRLLHPLARSRRYVLDRFQQVAGRGEGVGIVVSFLFGVPHAMSDRLARRLQALGLSHLFVVSGLHIGLMYYSSLLLLGVWFGSIGKGRFRRREGLALIPPGILCFLGGFQVATIRALVTLVFLVSVRKRDRDTRGYNLLLSALVVLMLLWPGCIFDFGVQLTFAALAGYQVVSEYVSSKRLRNWLGPPMASVWTSYVTVLWFGVITPIGVVVNFLIIPLLAIVGPVLVGVTLLFLSGVDSEGRGVRLMAHGGELFISLVYSLPDAERWVIFIDDWLRWGLLVFGALGITIWARSIYRSGVRAYGLSCSGSEER